MQAWVSEGAGRRLKEQERNPQLMGSFRSQGWGRQTFERGGAREGDGHSAVMAMAGGEATSLADTRFGLQHWLFTPQLCWAAFDEIRWCILNLLFFFPACDSITLKHRGTVKGGGQKYAFTPGAVLVLSTEQGTSGQSRRVGNTPSGRPRQRARALCTATLPSSSPSAQAHPLRRAPALREKPWWILKTAGENMLDLHSVAWKPGPWHRRSLPYFKGPQGG